MQEMIPIRSAIRVDSLAESTHKADMLSLLHVALLTAAAGTSAGTDCDRPTHPSIAFNQDDIKHLTQIATYQDCCNLCLGTEVCSPQLYEIENARGAWTRSCARS